jgi:hypothetical protein
MFASKEIVTIIFKIVNFVAIAWIIKYAFQKYIFPGIKEKLFAKFAFFRGLEEKNKNLIIQNELLEKEIKDQDKLFELLKEKIEAWNKETKKQRETTLLEAQKINSFHKKRVETQTQNIHSQKLLSEIFPRVIDGTFKQLEQKFRQEQEAEKFFRNIINYMQKNTQEPKEVGLQK